MKIAAMILVEYEVTDSIREREEAYGFIDDQNVIDAEHALLDGEGDYLISLLSDAPSRVVAIGKKAL